MVEPIVQSEIIANQARAAALVYINTGVKPAPFYDEGSKELEQFEAYFTRWATSLSPVENIEGSA